MNNSTEQNFFNRLKKRVRASETFAEKAVQKVKNDAKKCPVPTDVQQKDFELPKSTMENPLTQGQLVQYLKQSKNIFEVEKIAIPVLLTKAKGGETVETRVLSRSGKSIEETKNTAQEGFAIDTRFCINGDKDQYTKKPAKAGSSNYKIDDGRVFGDLELGETAKAHTVGGEIRKAFVAQDDLYIKTTWGEVQYVAKGGIVTYLGEEAIGNNNPCDLVIKEGDKKGTVPLTQPANLVAKDYEKVFEKKPTVGVKTFLYIAFQEDKKNPFYNQKFSQSKAENAK